MRQLWSDVKMLKGLINTEYKFHTTESNSVITGTATLVQLTDIDQGDTAVLRDGNSVKLKRIDFSGFVKASATANSTSAIRIVIFRDREATSTMATAGQVLTTVSLESAYNPLNEKRFTILADRCAPVAYNGPASAVIRVGMDLDSKCLWDGTNGATNAREGNIYALFISNEPTVGPHLFWQSLVRFIDN